MFSILVISTKKWYPSFLSKVFVFQKIYLKVIMPISQTEGYFESRWYLFLEEPTPFRLALKQNLYEKAFSCVKTKTNSNFAVKLKEGSNCSLSAYWMNHLFQKSVFFNKWQRNVQNLIDWVDIRKRLEAAKLLLQ